MTLHRSSSATRPGAPEPPAYTSYLVRAWQGEQGEAPSLAWRCEVEHIQSGQVWSFPSLQDGLRFIARQCEG